MSVHLRSYLGILIGTLTMEFGGTICINCEKTGYRAELEFKLKVDGHFIHLFFHYWCFIGTICIIIVIIIIIVVVVAVADVAVVVVVVVVVLLLLVNINFYTGNL